MEESELIGIGMFIPDSRKFFGIKVITFESFIQILSLGKE